MPNKNYLRGRRLEYEVVEELRRFNPNGFAQRMAGSHSPFDVIGFNPESKRIILVQCKTKVVSKLPKTANWVNKEATQSESELNISDGWKVTTYKRTKYIRRKNGN